VWFHEINPYRCAVLRKNFPDAVVMEGDIRGLSADDVPDDAVCHFFAGIGGFGLACEWSGFTEPIWTGGFPCTDISVAGKGAGLDGKHSGLWFEWLRVIRARRPVRLLIENVPALRTRGYDRIHDALDELGYAVRSIVVGAEAVGAPHRRNRVWIMADCHGDRIRNEDQLRRFARPSRPGEADASGPRFAIPDQESNGRRAGSEQEEQESQGPSESSGGMQLADAPERGLETNGSARNAGHADERGADLVNANGKRFIGRDAPVGSGDRTRMATEASRSDTLRWPMPPGPNQHEWEMPRLVESGVGDLPDGVSRRVSGFARRNALQALGDSIVPQVAAEILRAWHGRKCVLDAS
jgi:DNA (cytosine-5)-methyltransferase 1